MAAGISVRGRCRPMVSGLNTIDRILGIGRSSVQEGIARGAEAEAARQAALTNGQPRSRGDGARAGIAIDRFRPRLLKIFSLALALWVSI